MAILKSTLVNGDLTVTGSLNVQGNLTYVGVENLRVKDKQIELNANEAGSAIASGEAADQAGIVFKGTTKGSSPEASILYNYADDTLVVNKTIKGTVASANNAASADKVANKLTVNVTDETGSLKTVEFDGSEVKTVDVNLKGLQDQINSLTGGAGSIATQINDAISKLDSEVSATASGATAQKGGVPVLQGVIIKEVDGKLSQDTSEVSVVEVEQAGAAAAAKTELIGKDSDTADSATIKGAKKYADSLAGNYAAASHNHEISDVNGLQDALDRKAAADHTHTNYDAHLADTVKHITAEERTAWNAKQDALNANQLAAVNSGITATKVSGYDAHVSDTTIHVTTADKTKWNAAEQNAKDYANGLAKNYDAAGAAATAEANAKKYTDNEIKKLGSAAKKNVLTGTIADSSSDDLVTAAQVKAYAAGVVGAMHFRGAVESTDKITDPASGDICLVGTKEYVWNGTEWVLFGDEGAYDTKGSAATAEQNAKSYADGLNTAMDGRVDALEAIDHDAYKAADATTLASAKSYADGLADNYAKASHKHAMSDVTGLDTALAGKAASDHNHDTVYSKLGHTHATSEITGLDTALAGKQNKLDEAQLRAVNSGITSTTVATYDAHVADTTKHITADERKAWNAAEANAKKYADGLAGNYDASGSAATVKSEVIGVDGDAADKDTIYGAKKYADAAVSALSSSVAATDATQNGRLDAAEGNITNIQNSITGIQNDYVKKAGDTMTGKLTMNAADIEMSNNGTNGIIFGNMKIVWKDNAIEFVPVA